MKYWAYIFILSSVFFYSCQSNKIEKIKIGYIGPLTETATDFGIGSSNALQLLVTEYNQDRDKDQPEAELYIEDDKWKKENAIPCYKKLKEKHDIDMVFMSNTDGTVALQDLLIKDDIILVNLLNNDALLSSLNKNTFKIGKKTEDAGEMVALRIAELELNNVKIFYYPNDFMKRVAMETYNDLKLRNITCEIKEVDPNQKSFTKEIKKGKEDGTDCFVYFTYHQASIFLDQCMKSNVKPHFFGINLFIDKDVIERTAKDSLFIEIPFFTHRDGNKFKAEELLVKYKAKYQNVPETYWSIFQAYDAGGLVMDILGNINEQEIEKKELTNYLRESLFSVNLYNGVCGNISIGKDGASKGIYFSLYRYNGKSELESVTK
tara:strand:+ start:586 stop:1716 length:1131 start_codon:yes stop_codon:yes gene_type:complete